MSYQMTLQAVTNHAYATAIVVLSVAQLVLSASIQPSAAEGREGDKRQETIDRLSRIYVQSIKMRLEPGLRIRHHMQYYCGLLMR